jgi:hypothetical protein
MYKKGKHEWHFCPRAVSLKDSYKNYTNICDSKYLLDKFYFSLFSFLKD